MVVKRQFVRGLAWGMLLLGTGSWAAAEGPVTVPCPGGCQCIPNVKAYGYFPTRWREWPGEVRPDKAFPQVIGRELLPTPPGAVVPPPPKEVIPPDPIPMPSAVPPTESAPMAPLPDHGLPSQENLPTPAPEAPLPAMPLEPQTPPAQGTLPGLPLEPPETMPSLPSMEQGLPGLQSQPKSSVPQEPRPEKKPAEADKDRQKQSPATPDAKDSAALRPWELRGSRFGPAAFAGANPVQAGGKPGEVYISAPMSPEPPISITVPPVSIVTRADWQAETNTSPLPPAPRPTAARAPIGQQVVYQARSLPPAKPALLPPKLHLPANLPTGLGGYCPVELVENEKWVSGNPRWTATHQGRTYALSGPEQHQRFITNPSRYCPVLSGMDPVLAVDENREVLGQTECCVVYDGRLYMFSGAYSLARFRQNPKRYASAVHQSAY